MSVMASFTFHSITSCSQAQSFCVSIIFRVTVHQYRCVNKHLDLFEKHVEVFLNLRLIEQDIQFEEGSKHRE